MSWAIQTLVPLLALVPALHSPMASHRKPFLIRGARRVRCTKRAGSHLSRVRTALVMPTTATPATIDVRRRLPVTVSARAMMRSTSEGGMGGGLLGFIAAGADETACAMAGPKTGTDDSICERDGV